MFRSSSIDTYKVKEVSYTYSSNNSEYLMRNIDNLIVNVRLHISQCELLSLDAFGEEISERLYRAEFDALMRFVYDWFKYFPQLDKLQDYEDWRSTARNHHLCSTHNDLSKEQVEMLVAEFCGFLITYILPLLLQMGPMFRNFPHR